MVMIEKIQQVGYICKRCGTPSPVGIGYVAQGDSAGEQSSQVTVCACGYSHAISTDDTEMTETERNVNAAAEFWPMTDDEMERPCLVVGGVEVNAYFEGGKLRISVGIGDDVDPEFLKGSTLPCEVTVNGTTVWEA